MARVRRPPLVKAGITQVAAAAEASVLAVALRLQALGPTVIG